MKQRLIQITSLSLLLSLLFSLMVSAQAAAPSTEVSPQESNYLHSVQTTITASGSGKVVATVSVKATSKMSELGAADLYIYEVQSDGRYTEVAHYTKEKNPALLKKNVSSALVQMTYQGTAGKKYHAEAKCYAKNSTGSTTRWAASGTITAT